MKLKEIRKTRKLTQQQVADLLGINLKRYQNYEREVREPDIDILCQLADFYAVSLDELFGRIPPLNERLEGQILDNLYRLNSEGVEFVADFVDTLVRSGKYEKKSVQDYRLSRAQAS